MKLSQLGAAHIMGSEGLKLDAYLDDAGIPTIGWGHTGPEVKMGMKISKEQARSYFQEDVLKFEKGVNKHVKVPLTQNQYDSLVSFAYNVGLGNFAKSTLLKKLNDGDEAGAAEEFGKWRKAGGVVNKGLVARRQREKEIFLGQRRADDLGPGRTEIASHDATESVLPPQAQWITTPTTTDGLASENQRIASELAALVKNLGTVNEELEDNEHYLNTLRRESRGVMG